MTEILIDSYSEANQRHKFLLGEVHPGAVRASSIGQSFSMLSSAKRITKVKFYLERSDSFSGEVRAYLYSHSGTFGTNGIPSSTLAISNPVDVMDIPTPGEGGPILITFTFPESEQYIMEANQKYVIHVVATSGSFDATHGIYVWDDDIDPTHSGNWSIWNAGAWDYKGPGKDNTDGIFYVYGDDPIYKVELSEPLQFKEEALITKWKMLLENLSLKGPILKKETNLIIGEIFRSLDSLDSFRIQRILQETLKLKLSFLKEIIPKLLRIKIYLKTKLIRREIEKQEVKG